jgi:site-specific DNA-methyltransferase (adenine-specific)
MNVRILEGDALAVLGTLESESVQVVCTSPPYFQLRDYGCPGQIGLEQRPDCGVSGLMRLRSDLTEAQRQYVVRRLLGEVCPDV